VCGATRRNQGKRTLQSQFTAVIGLLPTNRTELLRLLRFLDEDYYESALSQTRFLSNSKRVAD
jgi:hypothetical protein